MVDVLYGWLYLPHRQRCVARPVTSLHGHKNDVIDGLGVTKNWYPLTFL